MSKAKDHEFASRPASKQPSIALHIQRKEGAIEAACLMPARRHGSCHREWPGAPPGIPPNTARRSVSLALCGAYTELLANLAGCERSISTRAVETRVSRGRQDSLGLEELLLPF
eukprot:6213840-Pleurochrysis_carterae.AAC.2